ncbi:MAG: nucleoside triphosphate pyrophosphohydrolase family protein [Firmicutes bacterium]|nr:nucleoside triphosphate pyrophosphohydrolase family protein [Bacillota bacterium]
MNFNEFQTEAMKTASPRDDQREKLAYGMLGLFGESGEVAELLKKYLRGDGDLPVERLRNEMGDVMWYIAYLCDALGFTMEEAAELNIKKLRARHGESYSGIGNRTGDGA